MNRMKQDLQDEALKRLIECADELICVCGVERHRGPDFEDVVVWPIRADQNALFAHSIYDPVCFASGGFQIPNEFDAEMKPRAAHVANQRAALLQRSQTFE